MNKVYGLWSGTGWLQHAVDGQVIHSEYPQVMAARKHNEKARDLEVREIGIDGQPIETLAPNPAALPSINVYVDGGKQVRPAADKAIHGPEADK